MYFAELKRILLNCDEQKRKYEKLKMENSNKDLLIQVKNFTSYSFNLHKYLLGAS